MKPDNPLNKLSISQLEDLLNKDEDVELVILPNGEITAKGDKSIDKDKLKKPLTMMENLGGEYGRMDEACLCGFRGGN